MIIMMQLDEAKALFEKSSEQRVLTNDSQRLVKANQSNIKMERSTLICDLAINNPRKIIISCRK